MPVNILPQHSTKVAHTVNVFTSDKHLAALKLVAAKMTWRIGSYHIYMMRTCICSLNLKFLAPKASQKWTKAGWVCRNSLRRRDMYSNTFNLSCVFLLADTCFRIWYNLSAEGCTNCRWSFWSWIRRKWTFSEWAIAKYTYPSARVRGMYNSSKKPGCHHLLFNFHFLDKPTHYRASRQ